jgi:chemotaxis protein MotA
MELDSWPLYLQPHSLVIVFFGSIAVLIFSNPMNNLKNLARSILSLTKNESALNDLESEIRSLSDRKTAPTNSSDPLLAYASDLWSQGIEPALFKELLRQKKAEVLNQNIDAITALRNLAKYPPALGMTGTVVGLVTLFANLGNDKSKLGGALALAMTATFFGLVLAHAVVMPLADRLEARQIEISRKYNNLFELILLIDNGEASTIIVDEVKKRA